MHGVTEINAQSLAHLLRRALNGRLKIELIEENSPQRWVKLRLDHWQLTVKQPRSMFFYFESVSIQSDSEGKVIVTNDGPFIPDLLLSASEIERLEDLIETALNGASNSAHVELTSWAYQETL